MDLIQFRKINIVVYENKRNVYESRRNVYANRHVDRSSYKGRMVNALALGADEGRVKLR